MDRRPLKPDLIVIASVNLSLGGFEELEQRNKGTDMMSGNRQDPIPSVDATNMASQLQGIRQRLDQYGTFQMPVLETGLYPAANVAGSEREYTNYQLVWVRDNIHIAHQMLVIGNDAAAVKTVEALCRFFAKYRHRLQPSSDNQLEIDRPHVRFDGTTLSELDSDTPSGAGWNHKQNDALGYYVWLFAKLIAREKLRPTSEQLQILALLIHFFSRIQYWQDEDSGHWEEWPKIEASSIGVVVAALQAVQEIFEIPGVQETLHNHGIDHRFLEKLIRPGTAALHEILPNECIQGNGKQRDVDSALLFLIYPLEIVEGDMADQILSRVTSQLQGAIGIARYKHDSFWSPGYKQQFDEKDRTDAVSADDKRSHLQVRRGTEAQWCIFDPILSCIYAQRFQASGDPGDLALQLRYLNRSLQQLTSLDSPFGAYKCPEAYYIEDMDKGVWVANDSTPLLWSQANLRLALHFAELTAKQLPSP